MLETHGELFELALERYREVRETVGATPGITFHDSKGGGQGIVGMPTVEFLADFEMAAKHALRHWEKRAPFFQRHFLDGLKVEQAARELKINGNTAWTWKWMLQNCVGHELRRRGGRVSALGYFYFSKGRKGKRPGL